MERLIKAAGVSSDRIVLRDIGHELSAAKMLVD